MKSDLWCAEDVSMVRVFEDVVVLDLVADRYECLVDAAAGIDPRPDGRLEVYDAGLADALIAAGLASLSAPALRPVVPPPRREIRPDPVPGVGAGLRAGLVLTAATAAFHNHSLSSLAAPLAPTAGAAAPDEARLSRLIGAARLVAPFIPFEGECLHRAYGLRRLLHHEGFAPVWVFGVRTWPFAAHCWIQIGDLVVGDVLDRVRGYTPIRCV